ncbi:LOW QUALITY PROTEIN: hypothetical protein Cgig2_031790 [Carnegiea gigantea]|uniref:Uncharacterized protein n=1 Tax=Carnegiea gigantea TaxID=171969 RepID=A0A9Q1GXM1_9CARY|nr:LOW QUALITY PROTEIN: hypothetical protein Cgig2_031790 [Carnegiea gigantea]
MECDRPKSRHERSKKSCHCETIISESEEYDKEKSKDLSKGRCKDNKISHKDEKDHTNGDKHLYKTSDKLKEQEKEIKGPEKYITWSKEKRNENREQHEKDSAKDKKREKDHHRDKHKEKDHDQDKDEKNCARKKDHQRKRENEMEKAERKKPKKEKSRRRRRRAKDKDRGKDMEKEKDKERTRDRDKGRDHEKNRNRDTVDKDR